jgi:hypothetical protein
VRGYDDTSLPEESFAYQIARMVKLFGLLNICLSAADAEESVTRSAQDTSFCTACPCLCGEQASTFISNVDTTLSKTLSGMLLRSLTSLSTAGSTNYLFSAGSSLRFAKLKVFLFITLWSDFDSFTLYLLDR